MDCGGTKLNLTLALRLLRLYLFTCLPFGCTSYSTQIINPEISDAATDPDASEDPDAQPSRCTGMGAQPLNSSWALVSKGRSRTARVHVPVSYDPTIPTPLVLNFHGYTQDPFQQALITGMLKKSDDESFIAVHPLGLGVINSWNGGDCCGEAAVQNVDDIGFVRDLIDELSQRLCIDRTRVFATGFSNGGFLAHRLACEASDVIAAIAPVAGVLGVSNCAPGRPMPVMHFHGTADIVVPYNGSTLLGFSSVEQTIDHWAFRNNCSQDSTVTFHNGDTTCETRSGCDDNGPVTQCTIALGGHTWPGGLPLPTGKTTYDISATDAMWDFFLEHPHPTRGHQLVTR